MSAALHLELGPVPAFLTAADVPPNLLRLKPGDEVRIVRPRQVTRVGYRKLPSDYVDEVEAKLRTQEGFEAWVGLARAFGIDKSRPGSWGNGFTGWSQRKMRYALAYALAEADRFGGPERGVVYDNREGYERRIGKVFRTSTKRVGTYYGASGGGEDYESAGLTGTKTIVLVETVYGTFMSGDLERVDKSRPVGRGL